MLNNVGPTPRQKGGYSIKPCMTWARRPGPDPGPIDTPSVIIATGPFGDIKNYNKRDFYLSWYPTGLLSIVQRFYHLPRVRWISPTNRNSPLQSFKTCCRFCRGWRKYGIPLITPIYAVAGCLRRARENCQTRNPPCTGALISELGEPAHMYRSTPANTQQPHGLH